MEEPIRSLADLGITDADLISAKFQEDGDGSIMFFQLTEEGAAIIEAYCHRMKIEPEDLLKELIFSNGI